MQILKSIPSSKGSPPERIIGREPEHLHPVAEPVQIPQLPAHGLHQLMGLLGMEIVAGHGRHRRTDDAGGNTVEIGLDQNQIDRLVYRWETIGSWTVIATSGQSRFIATVRLRSGWR